MPHTILNVPKNGMIDAFDAALATRGIVADAAQADAARRLQRFYDDLIAFKAARRSGLRKLLVRPPLPRGVWFWGGVGRGKSFLMDCFFDAVPYSRKRRVHFHAFMREIHEALKDFRKEADPLGKVAARIARQTRLMCFDEFHVSDIADAMILGRLMRALFDAGVLFCITSNYAPQGLYPNGLQRHLFLPTIDLLVDRLDVIEVDGGVDYRRLALEQAETYLVPDDEQARGKLGRTFNLLAGGAGHARPLHVLERELPVLHRAPGIVWFDFDTLCRGARSQNDYLAIADRHHTVLLSGVPRMSAEESNEARRFTWLIDVLYDHHVKLFITAECPVEQLYVTGVKAEEFRRTESRLVEMRTKEYLASAHRRDDEVPSGLTSESRKLG